MKRVHAVIQGRVQGVFFRACTHAEAKRLGLSGWVRNLPDGSVEAEFEGDDKEINLMLNWLKKGAPSSKVTKVVAEESPVSGNEKQFTIRY